MAADRLGVLGAMLCRREFSQFPHLVAVQAKSYGLSTGIVNMFQKTAVGAIQVGIGTDPTTGIELTALQSSLADTNLAGAIAAGASNYGHHARIGIVDEAGFAAEEVPETYPAPVSPLPNVFIQLVGPNKLVAVFVYSRETTQLRNFPALVQREITLAVSRGLDVSFLSRLMPSSGGSFAAGSSAYADLRTLISHVVKVTGQKAILAASIDTAQRLAALTVEGFDLFPELPLDGYSPGSIKGTPLYPSNAVAEGSLYAIDPSGVVASIDAIALDASVSAALEMNTAPDLPAQLVSMFGTASVALKATCTFTCVPARSEDVAAEVTGVAWTEA
jgi:hypothetical protein